MAKPNNNTKKVKRNELCPCGSGIKYKKCCGLVIRMKEQKERTENARDRKRNRSNKRKSSSGD